jgi:hypothetical protein
MSIVDQKKKVFGDIAALRSLSEGLPKINLSNSFPSINNKTDSMEFLIDLLKSIVGFDSLKNVIIKTITYNLDVIETDVKKTLKKELNKLISCGVNPTIPNLLLYTSNGINLELRKIDYLSLMLTEPTSKSGSLLYDDISSGINSSDFNTFLYYLIQNSGSEINWSGNQNNDILTLKFNQYGVNNNTLNIKASPYYSNNKKLTDLNNDYIDSIDLFDSNKIINNIIDSLFGTISLDVKKTKRQLQNEIEVENIINKIINSDETKSINDDFFSFSNNEIKNIESLVDNKKRGVSIVESTNKIETIIPIENLITLNENVSTATTVNQKSIIFDEGLNDLANKYSESVETNDAYTVKLNFIDLMIKNLISSIVKLMLSPKLITILSINHSIVYGDSFVDVLDFMKKNKNFIRSIVSSVRDSIISLLLKESLKEINNLVSKNIIDVEIEKLKLKKEQISGLIGLDLEINKLINNINTL